MTENTQNILQAHLQKVRKSFTDLLDQRLDDLEMLREQIDQGDECDEPYKQIQFIAHQISGTAGTLGFTEVGQLAARAENTIIQYLSDDEPDPSSESTIQVIDAFLEKAAEISSNFYWETA